MRGASRLSILAWAAAVLLAAAGPARAGVIAVDSLAEPSESGHCTLRAAIAAANTNEAVDGCDAGSGPDSVVILVGGTIRLTEGALLVTESLSLEGPGARELTVSGEGASGVLHFTTGAGLNIYSVSGITIANGNADYGGGIAFLFAEDDELTIDRCVFRDNVARSDGGTLIAQSVGAITMKNSTVVSRRTGSAGGAITAAGVLLEITNCTLASTGSESALSALPGNRMTDVLLTNTTIVGSDPVGIRAVGGTGPVQVRYTASIVAGHAANVETSGSAVVRSLGYNVFDDGTGGLVAAGDLAGVNPRLGALQENGGETPTIPLLPGSPAVDRVPEASCAVTTDQRRAPRPVDGDRQSGRACDAGAFEAPPPIVVDTLADSGPSGCTLRAAVDASNANAPAAGCPAGADGFDAITFGVRGRIALAAGPLQISEALAIVGPGAENLTLGGAESRVLDFVDGTGAQGYALYDLTIAGGRADNGAGVRFVTAYEETLLIERCAFRDNLAAAGGSALEAFSVAGLTVRESLFEATPGQTSPTVVVGNTEARLLSSTIRSAPSTFAGLHAASRFPSGAIDLLVAGCTLTGAGDAGLAVTTALGAEPGAVDVRIAQNVFAGQKSNVTSTQGIALTSLGYNVLSDASGFPPATGDLLNADPKLGPLQANGGPTLTQALLPGSPAIDLVPPAACATARDQRGVARGRDGNGDGKPACDAGAYEAAGAPTAETLALTPAVEACAIGAACSVTAAVRNGSAPVAGRHLSFTVTGANPMAGGATTDANGDARFTYTGTNLGADSLTATVLDANGAPRTATATKSWFDGCVPGIHTLCLTGERFRLEGTFRLEGGGSGPLVFQQLTTDSGLFVYDNPSDVQAVVKVLNVCFPPFERFWVFIGALTDQEVHLTVTDTRTGLAKRYDNALKEVFLPVQDTQAFATCP